MAVTATISISPSTVQINQPSQVALTISNSGGSAVTISNAKLISLVTGSSQALDKTPFAASVIPFSSGFPNSVPASGSLVLRPSIEWFVPSPGSNTFDVSALIQMSDGSYVSPASPATVTVDQVDFQDAT